MKMGTATSYGMLAGLVPLLGHVIVASFLKAHYKLEHSHLPLQSLRHSHPNCKGRAITVGSEPFARQSPPVQYIKYPVAARPF